MREPGKAMMATAVAGGRHCATKAADDGHVIFRTATDESPGDTLRVTVIATGSNSAARQLLSQSTRAPRVMEKIAGAACRATARCTAGHAATHSAAVSPADRLPEVSANR